MTTDEIARQWPLLDTPACRPELCRAVDTVPAARTFDPLYRRALEYASALLLPVSLHVHVKN